MPANYSIRYTPSWAANYLRIELEFIISRLNISETFSDRPSATDMLLGDHRVRQLSISGSKSSAAPKFAAGVKRSSRFCQQPLLGGGSIGLAARHAQRQLAVRAVAEQAVQEAQKQELVSLMDIIIEY